MLNGLLKVLRWKNEKSDVKIEEEQLVKTIESLIIKGYDKKQIKAKMSRKFNKKGGGRKKPKKSTTRIGEMNEALSWGDDGILLYNNKKDCANGTRCTPHQNMVYLRYRKKP